MNILHFSCIAPPDHGGIGRVADEIVQRLCHRGEQATLIAPKRKKKDNIPDASYIHRLPSFIRWGNAAALGGDLENQMKQADILHLHYPFFGTAEKVAQYALWHKKPLYITFHMDAAAKFPLGVIFDAYRLFAQPAIFQAAKRIFVSSKDYAEHSSIRSYLKMHSDRVIENPFGVDMRFTPGVSNRAHFSIPENAFTVGFVSVMDAPHHFKGWDIFFSAIASMPNIHALIVGDGPLRMAYEAKARQQGVGDRCHFIGRPTDDELVIAYRSMDVLATPSIGKAEAFGLVPAEALSCGTPVIASELPGVRTVVRHEETGILIPQNNVEALVSAIKDLHEHSEKRIRLSKSAVLDAKRFNWDTHVDLILKTYQAS